MSEETIKFTIGVSTGTIGSGKERIIEIDKEDLEGVPEDEWDDYVWEELGGKEDFWDMIDSWIKH